MPSPLLTPEHVRSRLSQHVPERVDLGKPANHAAVAAILRFEPKAEVLLIRRSRKAGDPWSGHMAFPGGRTEPADGGPKDTAIRETLEEVGVDLAKEARLLGRLDDLRAMAGGRWLDLIIVPFVFELTGEGQPRSSDEVDEALWAPLEPLAAGRADTIRPYEHAGKQLDLPGYRVGPHIVWGLTYRMLQVFFDILRS